MTSGYHVSRAPQDMLVQAAETGRDYEHCQALQRRLDDVDSDMRVDDVRIKNMNALADKLIRQGQGDNRAVQQKRDELNQRYDAEWDLRPRDNKLFLIKD